MARSDFDQEYRESAINGINPQRNLSNRVRKDIKFAMLKNIWPMETIAKFRMHPGKDTANKQNYKKLKEYLRKRSSLASFWLENWPQKNVYLSNLNFEKFKECLTKNLSTRATFEDDQQFLVFAGGDVSQYDDNDLRSLEKIILHADTNGKLLVAEMVKHNLVARCSMTETATKIIAGHLGALSSYIYKAVLDIVSALNLELVMTSPNEYMEFIYRISDTFELLGRSCKTKIARYRAQNYKSMMKMSDEHFFKEYGKLLKLDRLSQEEAIKDINEDYELSKKKAYRKDPKFGEFYEKKIFGIKEERLNAYGLLLTYRENIVRAQLNQISTKSVDINSKLLTCGSVMFNNSAWYLKKVMQIQSITLGIPCYIMEYGFKAGKKVTGSSVGGAATAYASYYALDMIMGAYFGFGIAPAILAVGGAAFATGYLAEKVIDKRANYSKYNTLQETLSLKQQSLLILRRRYLFSKNALDYLILSGYRTNGMEILAKFEKEIEKRFKEIEKTTKELETMDADVFNIIQKNISENYKYAQEKASESYKYVRDTVSGSYKYARDTASQGYNYLMKSIWG